MVPYNSIIYCMVLIQEQRMDNGAYHLIKGAWQHQHAKLNSKKIAKLVTCDHISNVELCSSTFFSSTSALQHWTTYHFVVIASASYSNGTLGNCWKHFFHG